MHLALRSAHLQVQVQVQVEAEPNAAAGADAVLRGLWIESEGAAITLDDNSIDLFPGTPAQIHLHTRLRQDQLKQVLKFRAYHAALTVN